MTPQELSAELVRIADAIGSSKRPSRAAVVARLSACAEAVRPRKAAQVSRFLSKEFADAMSSVDRLIERLGKVARTLNQQDEARSQIETSVQSLMGLKTSLSAELRALSRVQV